MWIRFVSKSSFHFRFSFGVYCNWFRRHYSSERIKWPFSSLPIYVIYNFRFVKSSQCSPLFHASGAIYLYLSLTSLPILNHIFIYSICLSMSSLTTSIHFFLAYSSTLILIFYSWLYLVIISSLDQCPNCLDLYSLIFPAMSITPKLLFSLFFPTTHPY